MKLKKLLLAGSHGATTGLSIVEEIKTRNLDWDIYWVGRKHAGERNKLESLEYKVLPKLGVKFYNLISGKIENRFTRYTILALLKIPFGFVQSLFLIIKIKPDLTLSLGGSSGSLVSFWSWVLKIPVIVHEQTSSAGRANIFSSKFAKKVAISRKTSEEYFPKEKLILTGNPINKNILEISKKTNSLEVKTILITGGSRGSSWLNNAVKPILESLLNKYFVIHQTGNEDFNKFKEIVNEKYLHIGQAEPSEWFSILEKSDIVISRAGANTVSELIALKRPSILVPIPWSYHNEQTENAKYMESLGLARILQQDKLTPEKLEEEISKLISDYPEIIKNTINLVSPDVFASKNLVDLIEDYI
ncbi:hypothetical protein A2422_02075 [Candidatus Woesebacteria bacterium RIFOXYC1_FULL_31_51]|uniref:UDP-N-acetylglucosamine--N-acetylmuramyl-(pentapeptide) pyrophosphoryl-undecaprenol N-acetylglucosamine transferase n=1 Tax=Candidatus Woesebacteria bacterium GW2011_GWC2_31_9 TaxID=1618586 RepID=A0A0G0BIZ0_9BACT|nr:MAG: UDP-N-acetylglucosamine--N-acetylmuramyl-(pentapeptide) pyrophosphoryl-UDP N-acetylglucosamine transferase, UDP-N-acetylglucosamine--N-acetylmuramyl-(pentapeptide) pyrophosphoryl-undecaprenol N-acetylglucosamine transferase [Candidatus Woesebacteria bacterium GW2011_GWF1_31_35]KKP23584.1 MAG: hypothetical protein UR11_C0001G0558 [Candidatus Woesebacteria bacterium GW2011_GWC1_30_29]KKP27035.1 MAG: hypothetical protein UR13_C0001G0130 [Candidatus Woesebacteria bacterium GW2011_GWD1_31_12]